MQDILPFQFNFQKLKPKGWYTSYRDYPISPQSSNNFWAPNDIVRFLLTNTEGVMDPFRSYMEIQVTTNKQILPVGGLYVDGTAQAFFSQTVITSQGRQVQRIQAYSILANYLNDVNFSEYLCQNRQQQGLGFSNFTANDQFTTPQVGAANVLWKQNRMTGTILTQSMSSGYSPTSCRAYTKSGNYTTGSSMGPHLQFQQFSNTVSGTNWLWSYPTVGCADTFMKAGLGMNVRAQYKQGIANNTTPDSTVSYNQDVLQVPLLRQQMQLNGKDILKVNYNPKKPYQIDFIYGQVQEFFVKDEIKQKVTWYNTGPANGYQHFMGGQTSKGAFPPMISPTIPQCQIQNGNILPHKIPVSTKTFRFPLLSAIVGVLIQPQQFLMIPMKALQQLLLQITLNPYAMVSTGYSDITQFDQKGMQYPIKRNFVFSKILWHLDLYLFAQKQNKVWIIQSLNKEIYVGATGWQLGSQYQIPSGQMLNNSWPTSSTAQFMNQIVLLLIPNDYQVLPFCRQSTRFSGNITSFQIRFNSQFFPPQPITGNAGNPQIIDTTGDNSLFYMQLLKSQDFMFNTNYPHPKINRHNFAINNKCYDPYRKQSYWPKQILFDSPSGIDSTWPQKINGDTAMGLPFLHQQRFQGKFALVYSWQPYGHSKGMIHGINANLARPFQIMLNTNPQGWYKRDQTMYIFVRYSKIVRYSNDGVSIIGI